MTDAQRKFLSYITKHVGQPYVWGGSGETVTVSTYKTIIDRKETSTTYNKKAKAFCEKLFAKGFTKLVIHDCSGYISKALIAAGLRSKRGDCDTLWAKCTRTYTPKDFTLLFRVNSANSEDETHIGVYYQGYQYHSKGRDYGVVKEPYKASYWHKMAVYPGLSDATSKVESNGKYVFKRALRNPIYNSEDVRQLKKLLVAKGYKGVTVTNGNYLKSTEAVVLKFQKDYFSDPKEWDGKAGPKTITALGGMWDSL